MATLLLRLAAPLQAWGSDSKFETRQTGREPTKSGVVGLLAAALGLRRDADLSTLNALRFGVRIDRGGVLLRDYHTVHSTKSAYVTTRYYLSDAVFLVGLECADRAYLELLADALQHPAFPLFLGRRACPPTLPLVRGIRDEDLLTALRRESPLVRNPQSHMRILYDAGADGNPHARRQDVPISFAPSHRQYGYRMVQDEMVALLKGETEHDPMLEL